MGFDRIVGHQRPLRVLGRALGSGRVPHAYLFWGPEGVGKETVAREVAQALLCVRPDPGSGAPCRACPSCRKLDAGSHPDLHLLVPQGTSIPVSEVRSLQETLSYQAFERGRKVAIIRDAFRMTREASNALLKTVEEPPAGTHILLLAHHRNQLLSTLVSRCQCLRFDALGPEETRRVFAVLGADAESVEALVQVAGGCPGSVWGQDVRELDETEREVAEVWSAWGESGVADRFSLASRWASEKDRLPVRLACLERLLRDEARHRGANDGDPSQALATLEALVRIRELLDRNVNAQLALDTLFLGVAGRDGEDLC